MLESADKVTQEVLLYADKQELGKALSNTQSIVERKNIIPVLSNVLLETHSSQLHIAATDMDRLFSQRIPADIKQHFAVTVDTHLLYDIVRKLDDRYKVTLSSCDKGRINIRSGHSSFTLPVLPAENFPKLDDSHYEYKFVISIAELRRLIDDCRFAMSREETRYNLNGIYLHYAHGNLGMAATDAHRIALSFTDKVEGLSEFPGVIVPKKTITELWKIIGGLSGSMEVSVSQNKILFSGNNVCFLSKLVDGRFPSYEQGIPKNNDIRIKVNSAFFVAVDRVVTVVNDKFKGIKLELNDNVLTISTTTDADSKAEESLTVETDYKGHFQTGINADYLLDILPIIIKDEAVTLSFGDSKSPILIEKAGSTSFKYVIMPMRILQPVKESEDAGRVSAG
jgi:DNA polymerase-3 subunit beta